MHITRGKNRKAKKVLLYGPEGIGKTTFASEFPKPLFLDAERGTNEYEVDRIEVRAWDDIQRAFAFLQQPGHSYQSVVIDTIDSAAPLLIQQVCREHQVQALSDIGYGKGYARVSEQVDTLLGQCNALVDRGIHVLFLAHSQIRRVEQPDLPEGYDKYELRLHERFAGPIKTGFDAIFFANYRVTMVEDKGRTRALGGKERVLYATHSTTHDAKNRCGIPERVPFAIHALAPLFAGNENAPLRENAARQTSNAIGLEPAPHPLDAVLAAAEHAQVTNFLLKRGQIKAGESYRNLSEAYVRRVLEAPDAFLKTVRG